MARQEYIDRVRLVIEYLHKCSARHLRSEHIREDFEGETIWEGDVEVFSIESSSTKAKHCYGWSFGEPEDFITILELPPVESPKTAVKISVAYQIKKARKEK